MAESSRQHWAQISEAGTLWGIRFMLLVHRLGGRWLFKLFLVPVIGYFYLTRTEARQISKDYLRRQSQFHHSAQYSSFRHFLMFGEVMLDKFLAWMGYFGKDDVQIETPAAFEDLRQRQQGAVIIISHLGNSELCGALMEYLPEIQLNALVYTQHSDRFSGLLEQANVAATRVNMMQVTDITPATAMMLSERVAAGEFILIAGDRTPVTDTGRTSDVDFMGSPAQMPQGAFILASLLKAPVYLLFCLKQQGRYHIYAELFAEQLTMSRKTRQAALDSCVQDYAHRLEHYCAKAPIQWFNFYSFWKH